MRNLLSSTLNVRPYSTESRLREYLPTSRNRVREGLSNGLDLRRDELSAAEGRLRLTFTLEQNWISRAMDLWERPFTSMHSAYT